MIKDINKFAVDAINKTITGYSEKIDALKVKVETIEEEYRKKAEKAKAEYCVLLDKYNRERALWVDMLGNYNSDSTVMEETADFQEPDVVVDNDAEETISTTDESENPDFPEMSEEPEMEEEEAEDSAEPEEPEEPEEAHDDFPEEPTVEEESSEPESEEEDPFSGNDDWPEEPEEWK